MEAFSEFSKNIQYHTTEKNQCNGITSVTDALKVLLSSEKENEREKSMQNPEQV